MRLASDVSPNMKFPQDKRSVTLPFLPSFSTKNVSNAKIKPNLAYMNTKIDLCVSINCCQMNKLSVVFFFPACSMWLLKAFFC